MSAAISPAALTPDQLCLVVLSQISGLSAKRLRLLLEVAPSPAALLQANETQLKSYFAELGVGKVPTDLQARTQAGIIQIILASRDQETLQKTQNQLQQAGVTVIGWGDADYPSMLAQIFDPPVILYLKGNPDALVGKTLGFVGTRHASDYGQRAVDHLIAELAPSGVTVVSGLAQGIDGAAHEAALRYGLPTVAVFGTGLDTVFPVLHKSLARQIVALGGALVSEYPLGMKGDRFTFPKRNRIIAGLSHGVVVVEGGQKSGSLITARLALEENRSVFAVPGNLFSPGSAGPHHLLKNGAVMTTDASDILNDLRWLPPYTNTETVEGNQTEQLSMLSQVAPDSRLLALIPYDPMPIEQVAQRSGLTMEHLASQLTLLELNGKIALLPGAKVCRR